MKKFIILDEVLDEYDHSVVLNTQYPFADDKLEKFYYFGTNPVHEKLIHIAKQYFNLDAAVGYEMWKASGAPAMHVDKDERMLLHSGVFNTPLCNMVYYADADCDGGDFYTEDVKLLPKKNRLIILEAGTPHGVNQFRGTRFAVAINPWHYNTEESYKK
jgi:hypothetical protein